MDSAQRMLIERACERLVIDYCHLTDRHRTQEMARLFAHQAEFVGSRRSTTGREAIIDGFLVLHGGKRVVQHVVTGIAVDVVDETHACGSSYFAKYEAFDVEPPAPAEAPLYLGRYLDEFVLEDDQWRFSRREVLVDFDRRPL